jgi:hypothetical protein
MQSNEIKPPSEGEEYIIDFLNQMDIKFVREKKIENLKNDVTAYRVADFYLT